MTVLLNIRRLRQRPLRKVLDHTFVSGCVGGVHPPRIEIVVVPCVVVYEIDDLDSRLERLSFQVGLRHRAREKVATGTTKILSRQHHTQLEERILPGCILRRLRI